MTVQRVRMPSVRRTTEPGTQGDGRECGFEELHGAGAGEDDEDLVVLDILVHARGHLPDADVVGELHQASKAVAGLEVVCHQSGGATEFLGDGAEGHGTGALFPGDGEGGVCDALQTGGDVDFPGHDTECDRAGNLNATLMYNIDTYKPAIT